MKFMDAFSIAQKIYITHCYTPIRKYYNKSWKHFILMKLYHGNVHMTVVIKMPFLWLALVVYGTFRF